MPNKEINGDSNPDLVIEDVSALLPAAFATSAGVAL